MYSTFNILKTKIIICKIIISKYDKLITISCIIVLSHRLLTFKFYNN